MSQKRMSSKIKQKQIETKMLEQQTKRMEEKLSALRTQVEEQKKMKDSSNYESTISRWRKQTKSDAPLKDYAKKVLADRKEALNKYGIDERKITGSKSFQPAISKIKSEKEQQEQKSGLRIPKLSQQFSQQPKKEAEMVELPTESIVNNFFKAKINTTDLIKQKSLEEFLEENFLQNYLTVFTSNGIKQLDDLYHLPREKMQEMGIKSGHQAKIIKRVKEEMTSDKTGKKSTEATSQGEKVSFGYGDGDIAEYSAINEEEEQSKQEKEEDRDRREYSEHNNQGYSSDDEDENENEEQEQDDVVMLTMPTMEQFSLQTNISVGGNGETSHGQFNCFQCYKKIYGEAMVSSDGRQFCSEACLEKYLKFMTKMCPNCEQLFYKFQGHFEEGLWFCSLKCCPNQEKLQQMFMGWKSESK